MNLNAVRLREPGLQRFGLCTTTASAYPVQWIWLCRKYFEDPDVTIASLKGVAKIYCWRARTILEDYVCLLKSLEPEKL